MKKLFLISALVLFLASYSFASTNVVIEKTAAAQVDDDEKKVAENTENTENTEKKEGTCEKKEESCAKKENSGCDK